MTITKADLANDGFRFFPQPNLSVNSDNKECWVGLWQKEIEVEGSTKTYFVNMEEWDLSSLKLATAVNQRFSPSVHFNDENGENGMEVTMSLNKEDTVADVLAFFERVRTSMGYLTPAPAPAA